MEGLVLPNSPEKLVKTVTTKASASLAESGPKGNVNNSKSAAMAAKTGRSASQNGTPGFHFPIGILKECEVQGELQDFTKLYMDFCRGAGSCVLVKYE